MGQKMGLDKNNALQNVAKKFHVEHMHWYCKTHNNYGQESKLPKCKPTKINCVYGLKYKPKQLQLFKEIK